MVESSAKEKKTLREKEKLIVMSLKMTILNLMKMVESSAKE